MWFGKKKEKVERDQSNFPDVNIADEPAILIAYGFEDKIELTASSIKITSYEKKRVLVENVKFFEDETEWQVDMNNSKVLSINKIPRDKISQVIIKQTLPSYIMYIDDIITIRFGLKHIDEFEKIFAELDRTNYEVYKQPKEETPVDIRDLNMYLVEEYDSLETASKEANWKAGAGWMPQNTQIMDGHVNLGRTAANVALLGPLGLVGGASRTKGKVIVTYVRTPQWLEEHNLNEKNSEKLKSDDSDDVILKLERIAKLRDQGILTEEEFQQQKIKILKT